MSRGGLTLALSRRIDAAEADGWPAWLSERLAEYIGGRWSDALGDPASSALPPEYLHLGGGDDHVWFVGDREADTITVMFPSERRTG